MSPGSGAHHLVKAFSLTRSYRTDDSVPGLLSTPHHYLDRRHAIDAQLGEFGDNSRGEQADLCCPNRSIDRHHKSRLIEAKGLRVERNGLFNN